MADPGGTRGHGISVVEEGSRLPEAAGDAADHLPPGGRDPQRRVEPGDPQQDRGGAAERPESDGGEVVYLRPRYEHTRLGWRVPGPGHLGRDAVGAGGDPRR